MHVSQYLWNHANPRERELQRWFSLEKEDWNHLVFILVLHKDLQLLWSFEEIGVEKEHC